MHEINVAKKILEEIGDKKIKTVWLEVGELCDFFPEELRHTLEKIGGIKVKIRIKSARVRCSCGYEGKPEIVEKTHGLVLYSCPKCKKKPKVIEGEEVKILKVE